MNNKIIIENNSTNINIHNNTNNIKEIKINKCLNDINDIMNNNKDEFIKSYNSYLDKIKLIDDVINKDNAIDNTLSVQTLFTMLEKYDDIINNDDVNLHDFKIINDIVKLIDDKLKQEQLNIIPHNL